MGRSDGSRQFAPQPAFLTLISPDVELKKWAFEMGSAQGFFTTVPKNLILSPQRV